MKLAVMGSINVDLVYKLTTPLNSGETRFADTYNVLDGGKGANQAVMLKALHDNTIFLGAIGPDAMGQKAIQSLKSKGLSKYILKHSEPTGLAVIQLTENDNQIVVFPGSNLTITQEEIDEFLNLNTDLDYIVTQLETNIDSVMYLLEKAHKKGIKTVLNPAPAPQEFDLSYLKYIDYLVPNEHEILAIFGNIPIEKVLHEYPKKVFVTLGEEGVKYSDSVSIKHVFAEEIEVVDTTGAGDSFIAGFVKGLSEGTSIEYAVKRGIHIASLTCQRLGAQGAYKELLGESQ